MELRDLEYFAVVAEHRNLGRASETLGLSPTALSKSLRRLEKAMQAKLVARTPKGVELTPEGDALLARVRGLRLSLDDVTREVADVSLGRIGHLRIGASPSLVATKLVEGAFEKLVESAPKVTLTIRVNQTDVTLPALRSGELDLVVSNLPPQPDGDLVHAALVEDDIVVIGSKNHPLATRRTVTLADLGSQRWALTPLNSVIRRRFDQLFELRGFTPPKPALEINSAALKLRLVAASDLLCYLSRWWLQDPALAGRLVEIPAKEMISRRRTGISYRKDAYLSPAAKRFIEILKATAKEIAAESHDR